MFDIKNKIGKWNWTTALNQSVESALCRLRVGHVGLAQYLFRFNMSDVPLCDYGEVENRTHFLLHCQSYQQQRKLLILEIRNLKINLPITVKLLLRGENLSEALQKKIVHR